MNFSDRYAKAFRMLLPTPFTIAIVLTLFTFVMAYVGGDGLPSKEVGYIELNGKVSLIANGEQVTWGYLSGDIHQEQKSDTLTLNEEVSDIQLSIDNGSYIRTLQLTLNNGDLEVDDVSSAKAFQLLNHWYDGLWGKGYLAFAFQMMLMMLLGHVLALSRPVENLLNKLVPICKSTAEAAAYVTFFTVIVGFFNWGLGLIFGAIFARKVGEFALRSGISINYPIVGAAGYSALMVWHGGISGSSLVKVSQEGHLASLVKDEQTLAGLPEVIPYTETVFSSMNVTVALMLILLLPLTMYWLGKKTSPSKISLPITSKTDNEKEVDLIGAEKLDYSKLLGYLIGLLFISFAIYKAYTHPGFSELKFIDPNYINFLLFGLVLVFHGSFVKMLKAVDEAINGVSGILLQFPLYFGIMGIMSYSGMIGEIADFFSKNSNETTYPIFTFLSAGLVNIFVPSGGGQWMVQGPIVLQTAVEMGISVPKCIMALAYGDQITNMLQPFWALPLLGITGLKAKEILPYTLFLMLVGTAIFITGLLLF